MGIMRQNFGPDWIRSDQEVGSFSVAVQSEGPQCRIAHDEANIFLLAGPQIGFSTIRQFAAHTPIPPNSVVTFQKTVAKFPRGDGTQILGLT